MTQFFIVFNYFRRESLHIAACHKILAATSKHQVEVSCSSV